MARYGYIVHSELCHHGIKGQRWGIRRYQNEDGSLTEAGRKRYGLDKADYNSFSSKNKERALKKEIKKMGLELWRTDTDDIVQEEADRKLKRDINVANNDKSFIKDLENEVKAFYKVQQNGTQDWMNQMKDSEQYLRRKYPEHADIIDWYSPHEHIGSKEDLDRFLKSKNKVGFILNNDTYYEPDYSKTSGYNKSLKSQAKKEYIDYFNKKYGKDTVNKYMKKIDNSESSARIRTNAKIIGGGAAALGLLVGAPIAASIVADKVKDKKIQKKNSEAAGQYLKDNNMDFKYDKFKKGGNFK